MYSDEKVSQWHVVISDKWLLSCLTWVPILLALSIWWIFSQAIARDLPIGVVDLERSTLSRQLIRELDATSTLSVIDTGIDVAQAKRKLINNELYAYVIIPSHFDRDIVLGNPPQITAFYNSQYILVGKLINSAVLQAHGTFNAKIGAAKQLSKGNKTFASALGGTVPVQTQITALFNRNANYAQFLVTAIVPALWQIFIVVTTILALTANHRIYGLKKMVGHSAIKSLAVFIGFYLPFYLLLGFGFLTWFYFGLDFPYQGSLLTLIYSQLLTIFACINMAALFFFLTLDPARAMSFAGAFTAPSFAFMGVTFPVTDMNPIATWWRSLLPISHYIEAQISQFSYNVTPWQTISSITPTMSLYLIPLLLCLVLINKHLTKLEANQ